MAIYFRKTQNTIKGSPEYGKWYPKAVITSSVDTETIAEELSHSSTLTFADIMAVLIEYSEAIHRHLLDGQKVSMYRLGSFRVGLKTKLSDTKKDCNADSIVGYRIRFSPDIRFNATGISDKGFPTGFYSKPLLRGIKAKEMKTVEKKE